MHLDVLGKNRRSRGWKPEEDMCLFLPIISTIWSDHGNEPPPHAWFLFRAQLLLDGATLLCNHELFPLHASLGSSSRSHNSSGQKQTPAGWVALGKGAGQVGHASAPSLTGRFSGTNSFACASLTWRTTYGQAWPLREHGGSAAVASHDASSRGCAGRLHSCFRGSDPVHFVCWTPTGLMRLWWGELAWAALGLDPLVRQI